MVGLRDGRENPSGQGWCAGAASWSVRSMTKIPVVLPPGDGELLRAAGNVLSLKLTAEQSRGSLTVVEYEAPAGYPGPPLHVHPAFDEAFFVLDGTLSLRVDGEAVDLGPGGFAFAPGAVPHTFANLGSVPVRFLLVCDPAGFEAYFRLLADAAAAGQAPDPALLADVSTRVGLVNV
jgi:mannose-6-phosphate isomerase-like protein (cupin superfamily)